MNYEPYPTPTVRDPLTVGNVLIDSLPATLFTDSAPEKYMIAVVFNRRPELEEIHNILSPTVKQELASAGYTDVELEIYNRRLEISNTSLEELRDGLAFAITRVLARQSEVFQQHRRAAETRFKKETNEESHRAQAVQTLASSISFGLQVETDQSI